MKEIDQLISSKTTDGYKKAAKIVAEKSLIEYGEKLLQVLTQIMDDRKKWETICALIKTLGIIKYKPAIPVIETIINKNESHDLITMVSGTAYIRIMRTDLEDALPVINLLKTGGYSVAEGALEALGYDKMIPPENQQAIILNLCWDFGETRDKKAYTDPRYGLAAACAGWHAPKAKEFLNHCLTSSDTPLKYIAENSLKGKYVKLR
jgi:hypothetical protein